MKLSVNRSAASFNRINIGINKMVQLVAQADLHFLHGILTDYHTGYGIQHSILVSNSEALLEETFLLIRRDLSGDFVLTGENPMTVVYVKMLTQSLNHVLSVNMNPKHGIKDTPSRLLDGPNNDCEQIIESVLSQLALYIERQDTVHQYNISSITVFQDFHAIQSVYHCIKRLEFNLNTISIVTDKLIRVMQQLIDKGDDLDYDKQFEKMGDDLNTLQSVSDLLSEKLSTYSENKTTLISLANQITNSMLSNIKQAMNHILSLINIDVIEPLLSRASDLDKDVPILYGKILNAMKKLSPYYDGTDVEDKLRLLQIWRYPLARKGTANVLQFMYPLSESWRTWALTVPLDEFVDSGSAAELVSNMMYEYSTVLKEELLQIRSEYEYSRNDVIRNFKEVLEDLKNFQTVSAMADDFVLWVFDGIG